MTAINHVTDYTIENRIAVVGIDSPPVNALGHAVRSGIAAGLDRAFADPAVAAVVLICGGRTFFAGADITEFGKPLAAPVIRQIIEQMEAARKPVVAAIHGTALGGGLELALGCHWRIALRSATLGLPEVKLGILAGAGGTQRLPRLVGAEQALTMVVSGDPIAAADALEHGLVDALAQNDLRAQALAFARTVIARPDALRRVRDMPAPTAPPGLFARFRADHAQAMRGFDAPEASIRCIEAAVSQPIDEGFRTERMLFEELVSGVQSAAQRYIFFAEREAAKVPGLGKGVTPRPLGAVLLRDGGEPTDALVKRLREAGIEVVLARATADIPTVHGPAPRLAIDFAPADAPALTLAEDVIVASGRKGACAGVPIRFGPHAGAANLLEILWTGSTDDEALATLLALGKKLGLATVVTLAGHELIGRRMARALAASVAACVAEGVSPADLVATAAAFGLAIDGPAGGVAVADSDSLITRLVVPLVNEGARMLEEGAATRASDIDVACVKLGIWKIYRGGPMFHADQIGLAAVIRTLRALAVKRSVAYDPSSLIVRLADGGDALHSFPGAAHA